MKALVIDGSVMGIYNQNVIDQYTKEIQNKVEYEILDLHPGIEFLYSLGLRVAYSRNQKGEVICSAILDNPQMRKMNDVLLISEIRKKIEKKLETATNEEILQVANLLGISVVN